MTNKSNSKYVGTYIDLFSGCGGLSLGLGNAGWQGLFAVEKDKMAFETFHKNMVIEGKRYSHFDWPSWLPQKATAIQNLLKNYPEQLKTLRGQVDLIAGGPPCQGFSMAGMRNSKDPRNKMSQEYIKMVDIIRPKFLVLENVRGFNVAFKGGKGKAKHIPHSHMVKEAIKAIGYNVSSRMVTSSDFGVPQVRTRFIMIGIREDITISQCPLDLLIDKKEEFLKSKGLPLSLITVKDAISDLEHSRQGAKLIHHSGSENSGFKKLDYVVPKSLTPFQQLMRKGLNDSKPNSLRIARHKGSTLEKFKLIQELCTPGRSLSDKDKEKIGTRKQAICVLDPNKPSRTLTTLPDDILHYKEPRILTVRESARIQSFPDDYEFTGKYTTGGTSRTKECPRYTQVGNAVPPLLGEAIGKVLFELSLYSSN